MDFAWNTAFASDPTAQALEERLAAAEFGVSAARAQWMPSMQVMGGAVLSDSDRSIQTQTQVGNPLLIPYQPQDQAAAGLLGNIPLYQGGKVKSLVDAADGRRTAEQAAARAYHQHFRLVVATEYLQVLRCEAGLAAAVALARATEALVRDTAWQRDTGQVDEADLLDRKADLASARYRVRQAELALSQAQMVYNHRLGRDPYFPFQLAQPQLVPESFDARSLTELALARRPELSQVIAESQALESQSDSHRAAARPQVNAGGGLVTDSNPFQSPNDMAIGYVAMTWQLYDAGRSGNQARQLQHQASAKRLEHQRLSDQIRVQVWQACSQYDAARARLEAEQAILTAADEQVRRAQQLYEQQQITLSDLMAREQAQTEAELQVRLATLDIIEAALRVRREAYLL